MSNWGKESMSNTERGTKRERPALTKWSNVHNNEAATAKMRWKREAKQGIGDLKEEQGKGP